MNAPDHRVALLIAALALAGCAGAPAPAPAPEPQAPEPQAVAAASLARATADPGDGLTLRQRWNLPTPPFTIAEGFHYVGTRGLGAFLFTTPDGHILLDGALPESVPHITASIEALGFRLADVKILINSHAHFDHSGGLAELKAASGALLAAHAGDVSALEDGGYLGSPRIAALAAPPVTVDRVLEDGDVVELGGRRLTAIHTPGHSRGCTSWSFTVEEGGRELHALVFCSATVAANRLVGPPQYDGIVEDYRRTFARLRGLKVDLPLAPHPEFFGLIEKAAGRAPGGPNPFIDPAAMGALAEVMAADFEVQLAAQTARAAARGQ